MIERMNETKVHLWKHKLTQQTLSQIFQNKRVNLIQFEMKKQPIQQILMKYGNHKDITVKPILY